MSDEDKKVNRNVKKPIVAIILSVILPGLGQIYNSQVRKGLFFIGLNIVINFLIKEPLSAVMSDPENVSRHNMIVFTGYLLAGTVLWIYAIVDARKNAYKINEETNKT